MILEDSPLFLSLENPSPPFDRGVSIQILGVGSPIGLGVRQEPPFSVMEQVFFPEARITVVSSDHFPFVRSGRRALSIGDPRAFFFFSS